MKPSHALNLSRVGTALVPTQSVALMQRSRIEVKRNLIPQFRFTVSRLLTKSAL